MLQTHGQSREVHTVNLLDMSGNEPNNTRTRVIEGLRSKRDYTSECETFGGEPELLVAVHIHCSMQQAVC